MKNYFVFPIRGGDWWLPILAYWLVAVVFYVPMVLSNGMKGGKQVAVTSVLLLLFFVVIAVAISFVYIAVFRIASRKLTIGAHTFSFQGSPWRLLGINLLGTLLSIVTLSIYLPWYVRRVAAYIVSETAIDEEHPQFIGRGGTLFKYLLFTIYLPLIAIFGVSFLYAFLSGPRSTTTAGGVTIILTVAYLIFFLAMSAFVYLQYKWLVQLQWKNLSIRWRTTFWRASGMILGQLLLSLITLFIYSPAAILRTFRYFATRTVVEEPEGERGSFGFDGSIGRGFGYLLGQWLLSIVTLGIYLPWAYARVLRWVLQRTYYEPASINTLVDTYPQPPNLR